MLMLPHEQKWTNEQLIAIYSGYLLNCWGLIPNPASPWIWKFRDAEVHTQSSHNCLPGAFRVACSQTRHCLWKPEAASWGFCRPRLAAEDNRVSHQCSLWRLQVSSCAQILSLQFGGLRWPEMVRHHWFAGHGMKDCQWWSTSTRAWHPLLVPHELLR